MDSNNTHRDHISEKPTMTTAQKNTIQGLLEQFPELHRASDIPPAKKIHIPEQQREAYLQKTQNAQKKRYNIAVDNGLVIQSTHIFDHTKRHNHQFDIHNASMRYQMMFSPENIAFIIPKDASPEAERICTQASVFCRKKIDYHLLIAYFRYMQIPLPTPHPTHTDLLNALTATGSVHHIEYFKQYLANGKVLDYFDDGTIRSTARVIQLPDGIVLVLGQNNEVFTEKHLRTYRGTNFFCTVYKDKDAYQKDTQQIIQKLITKKTTYTPLHAWFSQEYRLPDAKNLLKDEINTPRRHHTLDELISFYQNKQSETDKKIVLFLQKIKKSQHIGHITTRKENISLILDEDQKQRGQKQQTLTQQLDTGDL